MKPLTIKKIRLLPLLILVYPIFMILLQALVIFSTGDKTVVLAASPVKNFSEKTYHSIDTKDFRYETGTEGTVHWKAKSVLEAFNLQFFANKDAMITALGLCYTLILDVILFWMLHDLKPETVFSEKVFTGLNNIFRLSYFFLLGQDIFQNILSRFFLKRLTHGKFEIPFLPTKLPPLLAYFIAVVGFQLLLKFFFQAQKMEQEQNLTV